MDLVWYNMDSLVNEIYCDGVNGVNGVFTKNHIMCNTYARINCTSPIDTVGKILDYQSSLKKNAYKIGLIPIISRYARKVLFSGVF